MKSLAICSPSYSKVKHIVCGKCDLDPPKTKVYNTRYSQAVTHPSTNLARRCLTSVIEREPVFSTWYGRRQQLRYTICLICITWSERGLTLYHVNLCVKVKCYIICIWWCRPCSCTGCLIMLRAWCMRCLLTHLLIDLHRGRSLRTWKGWDWTDDEMPPISWPVKPLHVTTRTVWQRSVIAHCQTK